MTQRNIPTQLDLTYFLEILQEEWWEFASIVHSAGQLLTNVVIEGGGNRLIAQITLNVDKWAHMIYHAIPKCVTWIGTKCLWPSDHMLLLLVCTSPDHWVTHPFRDGESVPENIWHIWLFCILSRVSLFFIMVIAYLRVFWVISCLWVFCVRSSNLGFRWRSHRKYIMSITGVSTKLNVMLMCW